MGTTGSTAEAEHDGFYMLKKDSQRRTTLARVLAHDQSTLCKVWLSFVRRDFGQPMLTNEHLEILMKGLRDYIIDQNRTVVEQTMYSLKEQLNFDSDAVHQLHFSLYLFQDAVRKRHNNNYRHHLHIYLLSAIKFFSRDNKQKINYSCVACTPKHDVVFFIAFKS